MRLEKFMVNERVITWNDFAKTKFYDHKMTGMDRYGIEDFPKFWDEITKTCKPILKELEKHPKMHLFYRGMKGINNYYGEKQVRTDRRPKDTTLSTSNKMDDLLYNEFGWYPRKNGLFTVSDPTFTSTYGTRYIVFPKGNYKFMWSPNERDSFNAIRDSKIGADVLVKNEDKVKALWEEEFGEDKAGHWWLQDSRLSTTYREFRGKLKIKGKQESVKFFVDELYALYSDIYTEKQLKSYVKGNIKWVPEMDWRSYKAEFEMGTVFEWNDTPPEITKMLDDELSDVIVNELKYTDKDLYKAMESGNEIIFNCKSYYYIHEVYSDIIRYLIWGKK